MQGIISFSDRVAFNIKSNEHKDIILDQLKSLCNIKILQRHHHNLDNNNVNFILSNHLMNLRSNGNRYYLYFTLYNNIETMYFIDKKIHPGYQRPRIIFGRGLFAKALFKNTLLDGEMVKCKDNSWTFLINDIICYEGIYLNRKILPERLKIVYNMLVPGSGVLSSLSNHKKNPIKNTFISFKGPGKTHVVLLSVYVYI